MFVQRDMRLQKSRVILDTNLWISLFLIKSNLKNYRQIFNDNIEIIDELIDVCCRPKFQKYFEKTDIEELVLLIHRNCTYVKIRSKLKACKDPKDDFLLNLSIDAHANYLITGDKDLLQLKMIGKTTILPFSEFISKHNS